MSELSLYQANTLSRWYMMQYVQRKEVAYNKEFPGADFRFPTPSFFLETFEQCVDLIERLINAPIACSHAKFGGEAYYKEVIKCAHAQALALGMSEQWEREYLVPFSGIRYVVASANRYGDLITAIGSRHGSPAMNKTLNAVREEKLIDLDNKGKAEQGFIDQWDVFMTREEAWEVAVLSGQLNKRRMQSCPGRKELFSEDVW